MPVSADTTLFVTTIGDKANFEDCIANLKCQSITCPIEIIDHVAPMSAAFQRMHDLCRTPFYVQVDEDMILVPDAIRRLEEMIRHSASNVAMICAPLWDCDAERAILGVKIFRHAIVKQFPYEDTLGCAKAQLNQMKAAGYTVIRLPVVVGQSECLGEHGKHYTPETIFIRWQKLFQTHARYKSSKWIEDYPQWLLHRYVQSRDPVHLYAFLGAVAGISGTAVADREKDWRVPNEALEHFKRYFDLEPAVSPGLSWKACRDNGEPTAYLSGSDGGHRHLIE